MQFAYTGEHIQTNPKIPMIEICFEMRSGTILLKETYYPLALKMRFFKLWSWWSWRVL